MPKPNRVKAEPFRRVLEALEAREHCLRERIAAHRDALEEAARTPDPASDVGDVAFDRSRAEVEHDLIELSLKELTQIAQVRDRIAAGAYGNCLECGETIAPARLEVNPLAQRCAACQSVFERQIGGA
jgi:RNA polymerase-binding transcription factor DksA